MLLMLTDNNMSVAGGLGTSSPPHISVFYPFHNIIYLAHWGSSVEKVNQKLVNNSLTAWIEQFKLIASADW